MILSGARLHPFIPSFPCLWPNRFALAQPQRILHHDSEILDLIQQTDQFSIDRDPAQEPTPSSLALDQRLLLLLLLSTKIFRTTLTEHADDFGTVRAHVSGHVFDQA
ncbi:BQ5605_C005g03590 [Microbotryum silenes-dioicae]|uniref:BQ5605_C005g03590 protein n=1 Tax=Microbotryum silenes-dioicae TaxID=796604 RepID=A0A2X0MFR6_9BASI|nr:BQ5605_C005g03590 [Microbotryum silenes-dioicae]